MSRKQQQIMFEREPASEPTNVVSSISTFQSAVEYLNSVIILLTTNGIFADPFNGEKLILPLTRAKAIVTPNITLKARFWWRNQFRQTWKTQNSISVGTVTSFSYAIELSKTERWFGWRKSQNKNSLASSTKSTLGCTQFAHWWYCMVHRHRGWLDNQGCNGSQGCRNG